MMGPVVEEKEDSEMPSAEAALDQKHSAVPWRACVRIKAEKWKRDLTTRRP